VISALAVCVSAAGVVLVFRAMTRMTDGADVVVDAVLAVASGILAVTVLRASANRTIVVAGAVFAAVAGTSLIYVNVMIGWIYHSQYVPSAATGAVLAALAVVAFGVAWDEADLSTGAAITKLAMGGAIGVGIAYGAISAFLMSMAVLWWLERT